MVDPRAFRKWCDWLRRTFPLRLGAPYSIRLVEPQKIPGHDGYSWHYTEPKERYVSFVASGMDEGKTLETLIHEYAHIICWQLPPALGILEDDDELHAIVMQRIGKRREQWIKDQGL